MPWFQKMTEPANYSLTQIFLHWLIAALILAQYLTSGAIVRMNKTHTLGHSMGDWDDILHKLHMRVGLLILLLMGGRLLLRLLQGVPLQIGNPVLWTTKAARFVHWAFYALVIAQSVTGAVASYFWFPIAPLHQALFKLMLVTIIIHVAAATWHHFKLGDATLKRMLKP